MMMEISERISRSASVEESSAIIGISMTFTVEFRRVMWATGALTSMEMCSVWVTVIVICYRGEGIRAHIVLAGPEPFFVVIANRLQFLLRRVRCLLNFISELERTARIREHGFHLDSGMNGGEACFFLFESKNCLGRDYC